VTHRIARARGAINGLKGEVVEDRVDLAWARHAAAMGLSASEIRVALIEARGLVKKRSAKRQRECAERTAGKAMSQTE